MRYKDFKAYIWSYFHNFDNNSNITENDIIVLTNKYITFYWTEKLLLVIDYLQIYGILWNLSNPWHSPYIWLENTRGINYINLDFFSLTTYGATVGRNGLLGSSQWGSMNGYLNYALVYSIVGLVLATLIYLSYYYSKKYNRNKLKYQLYHMIILVISYILYLPILLSIIRLYGCERNNIYTNEFVLSADYSVQCNSSKHLLYGALAALLAIPLIIGLPVYMYIFINQSIIYRYLTVDHEKYMLCNEISYMLQLNTNYMINQLYLMSSFTLYNSYFYVHVLLLKIILVIIYISFRFSYILQGSLVWLSIIIFSSHYTIRSIYLSNRLPYRNKDSNIIFLLIIIILIVNTSYSTINSYNVNNSLTVASVESKTLLVINLLIFCIIACLLVIYMFIGRLHPSIYTIKSINNNPKVNRKSNHWIKRLKDSNNIKTNLLLTPIELIDIKQFEDHMLTIYNCWIDSKLFNNIIANILLDEIIILHTIHSTVLSTNRCITRYNKQWNDMYTSNYIMFQNYFERTILWNEKKRKILFKLFILQIFLNIKKSNTLIQLPVRKANLHINISPTNRSAKTMISRLTLSNKSNNISKSDDHIDNDIYDDIENNVNENGNEIELDYDQIKENLLIFERETISLLNHTNTLNDKIVKVLTNNSTEKLIDEIVVDEDVFVAFREYYYQWDDIISHFDNKTNDIDLPNFTSNQIESWYIYRNILSERLQNINNYKIYRSKYIN